MLPQTVDNIGHRLLAIDCGDNGGHQGAARRALGLGDGVQDGGTGMPNARPKQAAACWLVELGNGDKFLFDIGTGSAERISAMQIPYD